MQQSPSWEAEQVLSVSGNSLHFIEPEGSLPHYKSPSPVPVLSQITSVHAPSHFLMIHFNIILPSTPEFSKWSLSPRFPHQNPVETSSLPHTCYMSRPSHSSRFDQPVTNFTSKYCHTFLDETRVVRGIPKAVLYEDINQGPAVKPRFTLQLSVGFVLLKFGRWVKFYD